MKMQLKQNLRHSNQGFTMIELLVAMVVALLALGAIYSTFHNQLKSYVVQQETATMHQSIRAAMFYLQREIRMAGCDPTSNGGFGISLPNGLANSNSIRFTEDVRGPTVGTPAVQRAPDGDVGDPNEDITYALNGTDLVRSDNNEVPVVVPQLVAQNIDAIDFVYWDGSDPPVRLNPFGAGLTNVAAVDYDKIRSVEITIVARTGRTTLASKNNHVYRNQQGDQILGPQNDNFSRRRLTAWIKCRNLGL
jgi:type IV pilus assembly protein PilW